MAFRALRRRGNFSGGTVVVMRSRRRALTKKSIAVKIVQPTIEMIEHQAESAVSAGESLHAADPDILESQRAQAGGVQEVLGIDDYRLPQQVLDLVEVERAEFGPARAND